MSATVALPFRVGARTLWQLRRRLLRVPLSLEQARRGELPPLMPLPEGTDGYLVTSLPADLAARVREMQPRLRPFVRQRYRRSYARLDMDFDDYLAKLSSKSRSTLRRKRRRLAQRSGGALDLRGYRTPEQIDEFYRHARAVSAKSYQERLLDAGLPSGEAAVAAMRDLAARDAMRGWLLFLDGVPISYLYAPAEGSTLIYAHLGYDPDHAEWSPGTVLQLEAMRELMEEKRFRLFDFTEGEGQHKRQFETGAVDCVDLLMLRPTPANLLAGWSLNGFDRAVALGKAVLRRLRLQGLVRALRR